MAEVVLVHCNIVNNNYQQDSRVLYTFVPNKSFGQLLDISPKNFIFLKKFDVPVVTLSTQENSKLLEQLKSDSKRTINWNKYRSKIPT